MKRRTILQTGIVVTMTVAFAIVALGIGGCAPKTLAGTGSDASEGESASGELLFAWSPESDCAACHGDVVSSFDDVGGQASGHVALKDDCASCHNDMEGLEKGHAKVQMGDEKTRQGLRRSAVSEEACVSCHDKADLADRTADSSALSDKNGTTVNPHDIPATDGHAELNCSSCHKLHGSDEPSVTALGVCMNCHHSEVFECGTCH